MTTFRIPIDTSDPEIAELWTTAKAAIEGRLTLANLHAAFLDSRVRAVMVASMVDDVGPNVCRYCGCFLKLWPDSKHDGHNKCITGVDFQRSVRALYWSSASITKRQIADVCGVSVEAVNAWLRNAERAA